LSANDVRRVRLFLGYMVIENDTFVGIRDQPCFNFHFSRRVSLRDGQFGDDYTPIAPICRRPA
jgi:hypothetical protein